MVVSAVDLLYVFGRSFVLSDELTLLVQFGGNQCGDLVSAAIDPGCGDLILSVVPRRVFSNVIIIYRSLYSSDMCSCRAYSSNP